MATVSLSVALRSARANQVQTVTGLTAILRIYSGSAPAISAAATGTKLAEINPLPDPYFSTSADGTVTASGLPWTDTLADANGNAGYWRLYKADGTTCTMQGDITATGGGGSMTLADIALIAGIPFNVTGFSWTESNA